MRRIVAGTDETRRQWWRAGAGSKGHNEAMKLRALSVALSVRP